MQAACAMQAGVCLEVGIQIAEAPNWEESTTKTNGMTKTQRHRVRHFAHKQCNFDQLLTLGYAIQETLWRPEAPCA